MGIPVLCLLSCTDRYNPFADYANADVVFTSRSLDHGDTVEVFQTETLQVVVTVKELVESFTLETQHNRLWANDDTTISFSSFAMEPFLFLISYHDTGRHRVILSVSKTNGLVDRDTLAVYAQSPLRQEPVHVHVGDSVTLRTPPVGDRDAVYYWRFGEGTRFVSQSCSTRVRMSVPLLSGTGALRVSDGDYVSPAADFTFALMDTVSPEVVCVNEGFVGKDTIVIGDSWITFKVMIVDRGDEWVDSASVNGGAFDRRENHVYYKLFDEMEKHDGDNPLRLDVFAMDCYQFGNKTSKTFWVIHSDTIAGTKPARIVVESPENDTTATSADTYHIFGTVENYALDTLSIVLIAEANDNTHGEPINIREDRTDWAWNPPLRRGTNQIRITAFDFRSGNMVDRAEFIVYRDSTMFDTIPPRIIRITANGKPAHGLYTASSLVGMEIRAVDQETGIDSLTINDKPVTRTSPTGIAYHDTILLQHRPTGNEIIVKAVDPAGNRVQKTVVMFLNRLPLIEQAPASALLSAETLYRDTIRAGDPDGDTVFFDKAEGPAGLTVTEEGTITWVPILEDTGSHTVTIRVWDGYQPVYERYTLHVYPPWDMPPEPVRFQTRAEDFAPFLEADRDTMRVTLAVSPGTGIAPYTYSARFVGKEPPPVTLQDDVVIWVPTKADTGYHQMVVVVEDYFPSRDTIYPRILVVPPNRPGVITLQHDADTLADGTIDFNAGKGLDTLVFVFVDEDSRLTERHSFVVRQARSAVVASFDSAVVDSYEIVVDPTAFDGFDTLSAVLRDGGGYCDTLITPLYYGVPPDTPVAVAPLDTISTPDSSVTLSWRGSDGDHDSLWYDVYIDTTSNPSDTFARTSDTTLIVEGLTPDNRYYWRIVAHDWKRATTGLVHSFYIETR
ncbi:MAG: hypothetical protein GF363_12020 [Chitinivibrionales bacterium]|nr:hypothetical protein [Chitinivibrionales bacterium]